LLHNDAIHTVRHMKNTLSKTLLSIALGGAVALGALTNVACDDDNDNDGTIPVDTGRGGAGGHAGHGGAGGHAGGGGFGGEAGGDGFAGGGAMAGHGGVGGY
jgi:hypothetical protein